MLSIDFYWQLSYTKRKELYDFMGYISKSMTLTVGFMGKTIDCAKNRILCRKNGIFAEGGVISIA